MSPINMVLILLIFLIAFCLGLARGKKIGYNDCLEFNRSAFLTEEERYQRQRVLIRKAFVLGKIAAEKQHESTRPSDN